MWCSMDFHAIFFIFSTKMIRGEGCEWHKACVFASVDSEDNSVQKWATKKHYETNLGCVEVFVCSSNNCPAMRKILYHSTSQEMTIFSYLDHTHEKDMQTDLQNASCLVSSLLFKGITKLTVICTQLPSNIHLTDIQLTNLIQRLKKSSTLLPFKMTAADLLNYCVQHCNNLLI